MPIPSIQPGDRFGALTALKRFGRRGDLWVLSCDCGDEVIREPFLLHKNSPCECHVNGPARKSTNHEKSPYTYYLPVDRQS